MHYHTPYAPDPTPENPTPAPPDNHALISAITALAVVILFAACVMLLPHATAQIGVCHG